MNPRAVQMAKAVAEYDAGSIDTELIGNILAPQYRGWTNNSANYFTRPGSLWEPGTPFMGQPSVYSYNSAFGPRYRWFPVRPSNWWIDQGGIPVGSTVRAIAPNETTGTSDPPPIDTLATY